MKLKFDTRELVDFSKRLKNFSEFERACKEIAQEITKVLHKMLITNTPVVTGELRLGWSGGTNCSYIVKKVWGGYRVELINDVPYALSVNDGHYSYNQYGGPYEVKNRTVPYTQGNNAPTFVFGHFFVEKSILTLENSKKLEKIVYKELEKWFGWCVNG